MKRLVLALAPLVLAPCAIAADFVSLDLPGSQVVAVSRDGCVAAGNLLGDRSGGFRWSAAHGVQLLEGAVAVHGLSPSGDYVAGAALDALQRQVASYWDAAGAVHALAPMPDIETIGAISQAYATTDEPRVVGSARRLAQGSIAFEWTQASGMRALPSAGGGTSSRAIGISRDGRRIVGWERATGFTRAVLWQDGRAAPLAATPGEDMPGEVLGASRSGGVLVGVIDSSPVEAGAAYRWRETAGVEVLPGAASLRFHASSDDGRVLVGGRGQGDRREAWLWLESKGAIALAALLEQHDVAVPPRWAPMLLTAVSDNGRRFAGWGKHDGVIDSFVIDLAADDGNLPCASAAQTPALARGRTP